MPKHNRFRMQHFLMRKRHYNYPAISRFIHVTLNFPGICHQVLHSSVLQRCRVWCGEYGLYTEDDKKKTKNIVYSFI